MPGHYDDKSSKMKNKVAKTMREYKAGKLKSSSGDKVTNPKQAMAIGIAQANAKKKS